MKLRLLAIALVFATVAIGWRTVRTDGEKLSLDLAPARQENSTLAALRQENRQLRQLVPTGAELAILHREAESGFPPPPVAPARRSAPIQNLATEGPLLPGISVLVSALGNRGRATPEAALETTLWSAATGDLASLATLLELSPAARTKAEAILARLPDAARQQYGTPEGLAALVTAQRVPLDQVQLVSLVGRGPTNAVAFLSWPATDPRPLLDSTLSDAPPPTVKPADGRISFTWIAIHRTDDGWKLVVPPSALDRLAKQLASGGG